VKRYAARAGSGLATAGLAGVIAYFVTVTSGSGPHPLWPYLPLIGLTIFGVGLVLYHDRPQNEPSNQAAGHAFISYTQEDAHQVDRLQEKLETAGIRVWRDTTSLWPGDDWRAKIRQAIERDALAFIACFSRASLVNPTGHHKDELALAVEQLQRYRSEEAWFIPVRLNTCEIPDIPISPGRTLRSLEHVDLFGRGVNRNTDRLVGAVSRILADREQRHQASEAQLGNSGMRGGRITGWKLFIACSVVVVAAIAISIAAVFAPFHGEPSASARLPAGLSVQAHLALDETNFCTWRFGTHPIPLVALRPPTIRIDNRCDLPAQLDPSQDSSTAIYGSPTRESSPAGSVLDGQTLIVSCWQVGQNLTVDVASGPAERSDLWLLIKLPSGSSGYLSDVRIGGGYTQQQMVSIGIKRCT
jgi:TIR domain